MRLLHDSRSPEYRLPAGARRTGEAIRIRLRVRGGAPEGVWLRIWWENAEQRFKMTDPSGSGLFEYVLTLPDRPGLLWHYFMVRSEGEWLYYGNAAGRA